MTPLIKVIYDPYSITEAESGSFVVSTALEFSHARKIIEDVKAGQPSVTLPWSLVVRRESLLSGFQDILIWDRSLVTFQDVSPRVVIESALGLSLPTDITCERLISWGIHSEKDLPPDIGTARDVQWLLDVALENVSESPIWSQSAMTSPEWLTDWFCYLLTGETERLCSDDYLMQVVENQIEQWLEAHFDEVPDDLIELLFEAMSRGSGGQAARQFIARSLVRQYGTGNTKWLVTNLPSDLVGVWIKKKLSVEAKSVVDQLTRQLYADSWLNTLVQELDKLVGQEMDELNTKTDVLQ
jgi:hypothetical protein